MKELLEKLKHYKGKGLKLIDDFNHEFDRNEIDFFFEYNCSDELYDFQNRNISLKKVFTTDNKDFIARFSNGDFLLIDFEDLFVLNHESSEITKLSYKIGSIDKFVFELKQFEQSNIEKLVLDKDIHKLEDLIKNDFDFNAIDENGTPFLFFLISSNNPDLIKLFFDEGGNIQNVFSLGVFSNINFDIFKFLIDNGADLNVEDNDTGLHFLQLVALSGDKRSLDYIMKQNHLQIPSKDDFSWDLAEGLSDDSNIELLNLARG